MEHFCDVDLNIAKDEVELYLNKCKKELPEYAYSIKDTVYRSALKAYEGLLSDKHTGTTIRETIPVIKRLIDHKPLFPITDTPDDWEELSVGEGMNFYGIHKHYDGLFKIVYKDGRVKYKDIFRTSKMLKEEKSGEEYRAWHSGFISNLIDELYPITFPYMPYDDPYLVYCMDIPYTNNGLRMMATRVDRIVSPDGIVLKLYKYYVEKGQGFVEVSKEEFKEVTGYES